MADAGTAWGLALLALAALPGCARSPQPETTPVEVPAARVAVGALGRWRVAGPFPFAPDVPIAQQTAAPETSIDPTQGWRVVECDAEGAVNLRRVFDLDDRVAYGVTFLRAPQKLPVMFRVWSDDSVEMWRNGRKIHSHDVVRTLHWGPDAVQKTLHEGANTLLVKVANGTCGWGFRVRLESKLPIVESASPD